jgi:arylsulfatase A
MTDQNQSRRSFCKQAGAGLTALSASSLLGRCGDAQAQPNVIYIMADDLGYGDLGCYGQEKIRTPFIDQMAAEGMRFTDHYSGHPVCAPSRCSLMTGLHNGHAVIRGNYEVRPEGQLAIPSDAVTVAEIFKQAGYATGGVGKWGLGGPDSEGHPNNQGFDYWYGHLCQRKAHSYYPDYVWRNNEKVVFADNNPAEQKGEYIHDYFTEEALQFVEREKDGPFFLYLPYSIPHLEFVAPEDSMEEYRGKFPETPFAGTGYHEELPESPDIPFPGNYGPQTHPRAAYAAMITRMDRDVGKLLTLLKELNIDDNTLVIFTSDNGAAQGKSADAEFFNSCPGMKGSKGYVYEGGIRVPFIARWPGKIQPGTVSEHVSAFWDFLPTAVDITGVATPSETDGISYLPTLLGQNTQEMHEYLYWEFKVMGMATQAVRLNNWKAVRFGPRPLELYDLSNDMAEQHNLADAQPEIAALISRIMMDARTESKEFPLF